MGQSMGTRLRLLLNQSPTSVPERDLSAFVGTFSFRDNTFAELSYKQKLLQHIVARLGTEKHRLAVPTRESEAFLSEIAESKGGNRQISAGAPLDSPKLAER